MLIVKCPQYSSVGLFISFSALNNINECLVCKLIILLAVAGFEDWYLQIVYILLEIRKIFRELLKKNNEKLLEK